MPINKVDGVRPAGYAVSHTAGDQAMADRKERNSAKEKIMKYHDDVASEEIIRATERHLKKLIEALKKA